MASSATPPPSVHLPPRLLRCLPAEPPVLSRRVDSAVPPVSSSASCSSKAGLALRVPAVDRLRCAPPQLCEHETLTVDWSCVSIGEAREDDELRVRSFYEFNQSYNIESVGITDLYVHVTVDNEAAKKLYEKTGSVYENEEPAWQARFLG